MPTVTPLSLRVKELREAKGLTQAQLADLVGIRRASLSAIENNSTDINPFGQRRHVDFFFGYNY